MYLKQIKEDYELVRDLVLKKVFNTEINPIRGHEMSYLINSGMKKKNYLCFVENGIYDNRMQHS